MASGGTAVPIEGTPFDTDVYPDYILGGFVSLHSLLDPDLTRTISNSCDCFATVRDFLCSQILTHRV